MPPSCSQSQLRSQPGTCSKRQQHIQAEILPLTLDESRYAWLGNAQAPGRLRLRPTHCLQVPFHPDHHFGAQRHDSGLGWIEAEVNEYVAAALDAAGIGSARVGLLLHGLVPSIL